MSEIIWFYLFIILFFICIILYYYSNNDQNNVIEGYREECNKICECKIHVPGLLRNIKGIPKPRPIKIFGKDINPGTYIVAALNRAIVDPINRLIGFINKGIRFIYYLERHFITCVLLYILDAIGKFHWWLIEFIFKIIQMRDVPIKIYKFLDDNIDRNLYEFTGIHIMHFPTKYQNRCYRPVEDENRRIKCWMPDSNETNNNKIEGVTSIENNIQQNMSFYKLLLTLLGLLISGLLSYAFIYWIITNYQFYTYTAKCIDKKTT
jgi:hypothetical protein